MQQSLHLSRADVEVRCGAVLLAVQPLPVRGLDDARHSPSQQLALQRQLQGQRMRCDV